MKTFSYHSPKDVKEASKLASSSSMFLAGGMTSIPSMKLKALQLPTNQKMVKGTANIPKEKLNTPKKSQCWITTDEATMAVAAIIWKKSFVRGIT